MTTTQPLQYISDQDSIAYPEEGNEIAENVEIGTEPFSTSSLPRGVVLQPEVGLVTHENLDGQLVHVGGPPRHMVLETRAVITPEGDYLLLFPDGLHYGWYRTKEQLAGGKWNDMIAYRSKDRGKTWQGPGKPFDIDYNQHGFIPLIPRGSSRIYAFGTQPVWAALDISNGHFEDVSIGYRHSDDDGYTWSAVRLIRPRNDPEFRGMSVTRMCETDAGTWLLGAHSAQWNRQPVGTRQYILRSEDRGQSWELLPGPRDGGWTQALGRLEETRLINLGGGNVLAHSRTVEGHVWQMRSDDDGKTWSRPKSTPLVHPSAPPMLFHLSDGKTLVALHHNRNHGPNVYKNDEFSDPAQMADRSEIWAAFSTDEGRTWGEPRFVFANALGRHPMMSGWRNHQCSYVDMIIDAGMVHLFVPHRWQRALHLWIKESDFLALPTKAELGIV